MIVIVVDTTKIQKKKEKNTRLFTYPKNVCSLFFFLYIIWTHKNLTISRSNKWTKCNHLTYPGDVEKQASIVIKNVKAKNIIKQRSIVLATIRHSAIILSSSSISWSLVTMLSIFDNNKSASLRRLSQSILLFVTTWVPVEIIPFLNSDPLTSFVFKFILDLFWDFWRNFELLFALLRNDVSCRIFPSSLEWAFILNFPLLRFSSLSCSRIASQYDNLSRKSLKQMLLRGTFPNFASNFKRI